MQDAALHQPHLTKDTHTLAAARAQGVAVGAAVFGACAGKQVAQECGAGGGERSEAASSDGLGVSRSSQGKRMCGSSQGAVLEGSLSISQASGLGQIPSTSPGHRSSISPGDALDLSRAEKRRLSLLERSIVSAGVLHQTSHQQTTNRYAEVGGMRVIVGLVDRHAGSLLHPLITPQTQTHTQPRMEIEPAIETRAQDETLAGTRTETETEEGILDTRPHQETQDTRPHDQTIHRDTPAHTRNKEREANTCDNQRDKESEAHTHDNQRDNQSEARTRDILSKQEKQPQLKSGGEARSRLGGDMEMLQGCGSLSSSTDALDKQELAVTNTSHPQEMKVTNISHPQDSTGVTKTSNAVHQTVARTPDVQGHCHTNPPTTAVPPTTHDQQQTQQKTTHTGSSEKDRHKDRHIERPEDADGGGAGSVARDLVAQRVSQTRPGTSLWAQAWNRDNDEANHVVKPMYLVDLLRSTQVSWPALCVWKGRGRQQDLATSYCHSRQEDSQKTLETGRRRDTATLYRKT